MSDVMQEVDERSKLAGTNKFELLIFRLGQDQNTDTREVFGINVFKVREALIMPSITPMPGSPKHVLGVANIRGQIIPVIDLPSVIGCTPYCAQYSPGHRIRTLHSGIRRGRSGGDCAAGVEPGGFCGTSVRGRPGDQPGPPG